MQHMAAQLVELQQRLVQSEEGQLPLRRQAGTASVTKSHMNHML